MRKFFLTLALILFSGLGTQAADLRCQGDLMTPGTFIFKVRQKCGQPVWEERVGEIRVSNRDDQERYIYVTLLVYEVGTGTYVLTFEGGRLVRTEFLKN